jgi:hypothetical protein
VTHDPNEEVPTASRKFPVIYKVTSKGRAKETWWLYESDAPQAVKKSWRLRVNENKINNAICKKGGVLEGEFKSILSKPSNKERRRKLFKLWKTHVKACTRSGGWMSMVNLLRRRAAVKS